MIPALRLDFNKRFAAAKYREFEREMAERCGTPVKVSALRDTLLLSEIASGSDVASGQRTHSPAHQQHRIPQVSDSSIPVAFRVPNEPDRPMFVQVDFGLVRDGNGQLQPSSSNCKPSLLSTPINLCWRRRMWMSLV